VEPSPFAALARFYSAADAGSIGAYWRQSARTDANEPVRGLQKVGAAIPGRFRPIACKQNHRLVEKAIRAMARAESFQRFDATFPTVPQSMVAHAILAMKHLASCLRQTRLLISRRVGRRHPFFPAEQKVR
jgi:hypothetical protein